MPEDSSVWFLPGLVVLYLPCFRSSTYIPLTLNTEPCLMLCYSRMTLLLSCTRYLPALLYYSVAAAYKDLGCELSTRRVVHRSRGRVLG